MSTKNQDLWINRDKKDKKLIERSRVRIVQSEL